ncbi:MAG: GxxExxY protein [Patescibacteria group bacterium]|nr:GxxExxY protein [Patescibacteria group bacterium]
MSYLYEKETYILRGIFFKVYNALGPGLNERIYQRAICKELTKLKIPHDVEKQVNIYYEKEKIGSNKLDLLVNNKIIIEIKSTEHNDSKWLNQTIGYLKSTGYKLALLVNFGGQKLIIKRFINQSKNDKIKST